jgi:iron complex transport system ATP-binding protein
VVFTYPPIGPLNSGNLRLVEEALAMGMEVYGIGSARPYEIPGLRTVDSVEMLFNMVVRRGKKSVWL